MAKRVLLGMSGGVDSSVSAILLKEQGYDVIGVTMKLWEGEIEGSCCSLSSTLDAKRVCDKLSIPHYTVNFKEVFQKCVVQDFIHCYAASKTPNPCIMCNRYLKFGKMFQMAEELECEAVATGHYAKVQYDEKWGQYVLKKANALAKDQSYVLYNIPKERLGQVKFPLGEFRSKQEVRKIAEENDLSVATKPDSEDICFIPDGNYTGFLESKAGFQPQVGDIVNRKGERLGKHKGLYHYTIGQRKGLGVSYPTPLYVLGFNQKENLLIVGEEAELYQQEFIVEDVNWLVEKPLEYEEIQVKTRYSTLAYPAKIQTRQNKLVVQLKEPQKAITPGQSAVLYTGDVVLGGGKID